MPPFSHQTLIQLLNSLEWIQLEQEGGRTRERRSGSEG